MSASTTELPFQVIAPYLAVGTRPPDGWHSISTLPMLILVGVTGVGKSTLLSEMSQHDTPYLLLPDRRHLTDQLIISHMQTIDGVTIAPVTDRGQRFAYTRRYRELYEGGMAHALTQLWISARSPGNLLVFDGLRGANEVAYAATVLPQARFIMLDAPDLMRLQRLLGRGDAFDRIHINTSESSLDSTPNVRDAADFVGLGLPQASTIFNADEEKTILSWLRDDIVTSDALRAKLQIVIEERRSYDPLATLEALRAHAPHSTLHIDTVTHSPAAVATQVISWIGR